MTNYIFTANQLKQPARVTDFVGSLVDENLKSHPKQFWNYVSQLRK
jgi:hypothetical protein